MTPASVQSSYCRMLAQIGENVTIRRYTGAGIGRPYFDCAVRARVADYQPHELVDGIVQGDRRLIVLAQDLIDRQFALPVRVKDKVIVRGAELNVEAVDDSTRRVAGVLVAIELRARG